MKQCSITVAAKVHTQIIKEGLSAHTLSFYEFGTWGSQLVPRMAFRFSWARLFADLGRFRMDMESYVLYMLNIFLSCPITLYDAVRSLLVSTGILYIISRKLA